MQKSYFILFIILFLINTQLYCSDSQTFLDECRLRRTICDLEATVRIEKNKIFQSFFDHMKKQDLSWCIEFNRLKTTSAKKRIKKYLQHQTRLKEKAIQCKQLLDDLQQAAHIAKQRGGSLQDILNLPEPERTEYLYALLKKAC